MMVNVPKHTVGTYAQLTTFSLCARMVIAGFAFIASVAGVTSCGAPAANSTPVAETIVINTQPEAVPFVKDLADSFARGRSGLNIIVNQMAEADGVADLRQGNATLATVAAPLAADHSGWSQMELARQPISIIVHPDNAIRNLTLDDLGNIYTGRVTDWKDIGGPAMPIMVLSREAEASERQRLDAALIGPDSKLTPNALLLPSDEAMIVTVARRPEAIGYILGAATVGSIKTVAVEGEQPASLARGRYYPLWRPIILISPAQASANVSALLAYVKGRQGQRVIVSWGYGQGGSLP